MCVCVVRARSGVGRAGVWCGPCVVRDLGLDGRDKKQNLVHGRSWFCEFTIVSESGSVGAPIQISVFMLVLLSLGNYFNHGPNHRVTVKHAV